MALSTTRAPTIISTDLYCALFGTQGKIGSYNYVTLQGSEGIESIKVDCEYAIGNIVFLKSGVYNLNDIDVKCRSGYSFDGWYYLDLDGKECKVLDPENFLVAENMTIYAKATQNQSDYGMYFIAIIAILIIVAIIAFAYTVLRGRGVIGY